MAFAPGTDAAVAGWRDRGRLGPGGARVALAQVSAVSAAVTIPIVGMGGVQSGADALDLLRAGATVVAVGTESFRDPAAGLRIAAELPRLHGFGAACWARVSS